MIATLADTVPNFSFGGGDLFYFLVCFNLPLENLKWKVLCLCWGGHLLSLKIHTDICSHFGLGQCLLSLSLSLFFKILFFHLPHLYPCPILRENAMYSYRRCVNSRPFSLAHSSSSASIDVLCKISWAVSFCFSMPPLYSNCGLLVGVWDPLGTDAHSWDLLLSASVYRIVVMPTVCTSLQKFFPAEKQWALGLLQSHALA